MTTLYTATFKFAKPDFRSAPWSALLLSNFDAIDAALTNVLAASSIVTWANNTHYGIGVIAIDNSASPPTFWVNGIDHTSASTGTFANERVSHTDYWSSLTFGITPRGEWAHNTAYAYYDIAYDSTNGVVGLCLIPHTSGATGTISTTAEKANWVFIVDLPSVGTTPATSISFNNATAALPGSPANVQTAIEALDSRVDSAATIVSAIAASQTTDESTIAAHTTSISGLSSSVGTLNTEMSTAQSDITNHTSRLDTLDAEVAALGAGFPATTAMLFWQAAAPTGWTKSTTHNDKALRVVSGTGGGNAGSVAFSTVFGRTASDATTISTSTMPSHTHGYNDETASSVVNDGTTHQEGSGASYNVAGSVSNTDTARTTGANGSGGSHTHGMDLRVQYLDLIICTKN